MPFIGKESLHVWKLLRIVICDAVLLNPALAECKDKLTPRVFPLLKNQLSPFIEWRSVLLVQDFFMVWIAVYVGNDTPTLSFFA